MAYADIVAEEGVATPSGCSGASELNGGMSSAGRVP